MAIIVEYLLCASVGNVVHTLHGLSSLIPQKLHNIILQIRKLRVGDIKYSVHCEKAIKY